MDTKLKLALRELEKYNGIFRQIWDMGRIRFTDSVPRAGVTFDVQGNFISFLFNKTFYDSITPYELAFVIGHECMHLLLYHGRRLHTNKIYELNMEIWNIAADVSLHEIMYREFGFDKSKVSIEHCTVDNMFADTVVERGQTLDYYFNKLCEGKNKVYIQMDSHSFGENYEKLEEAVNKAFNRITPTEQQELKEKLKDVSRGDKKGDNWFDVTVSPLTKKKWEMVLKEYSQAFITADKFDWTKNARRTHGFATNMFLPSHLEETIKKQRVWLFMDTSGSCINLASRFFSAAASLPTKFFDVRLFCFDTEIYETDIRSQKVQGGGGTSFDIIESYISRQSGRPDRVFVITDGYGNQVVPANPQSWDVFLTSDYKDCFPKDCRFHSFEEFE